MFPICVCWCVDRCEDDNMIKEEFFERMQKVLPEEEYGKFLHAINEPFKRGLVLNKKKLSEEKLEQTYDIIKLPYGDACYEIGGESLGGEIFHRAGAFYLQEPSAMIPGIVLPTKTGDKVLDMCAAPGGKTFQIARRLDGTLVSNEIDYQRAKILLSNVERLGLDNTVVTNFSPKELSEIYPNKFDCVLVDAPCSGEGMFRKEEYAQEQWTPEYVKKCAKMQQEILDCADKTLKTGGYLVYSTCTFSKEENEENIRMLVNKGYELVDIGDIAGQSPAIKLEDCDTSFCKRFYFHNSYGEGQFVGVLRKCVQNTPVHFKERPIEKLGNSYKKLVVEFLSNNTTDLLGRIEDKLFAQNDAIYYAPDPSLLTRNKGILSFGVKLGVVVKNRFEPCHNLWTAFGEYFNNKVELDVADSEKYLKGEAISKDTPNGWCAVVFDSVVLGGGKVTNGLVKNHYPKGLRK